MPIQLSGSLVITGSITTTGVITMSGSIASASYSSTSDLLQGTGSVGFTTTASFNAVSSSQQQISASYIALSASYNVFSGSASTRITANSSSIQQVSASQQQISASLLQVSASYIALSGSYNTFSGSASTRVTQIEQVYATTGSNSFRADQSITGSLVVSSTITAQTLIVQTVTSSIVYSSGSNIFGCDLNSRQTFTGSVNITGSTTLNGALTGTSATFNGDIAYNNVGNQNLIITSGAANNGRMYIYSAGNADIGFQASGSSWFLNKLGIGTNAPTYKLEISGSSGTFSFNPNQASAMIIRGSVTGNFDINNEGASGAMRLYGTSIQLRTAATDPALTIASTGAATFACSVTATSLSIASNTGGITLNRTGTSNYSTILYQSAAADKWYVGMRENNATSDYILYNATNDTNTLRLSVANNSATFSSTITGTTIYGSTAVCSPVGKFTSCIDAGTGTFSGNALTVSGANPSFTLTTSDTTLYSYIALTGGTSSNYIYTLANSYNTTGPYVAGALTLVGTTSGGISIAAQCASGLIRFYTCEQERMRITSAGILQIGGTNAAPWNISSGTVSQITLNDSTNGFPLVVAKNSNILAIFNQVGTAGTMLEFKYNASVNGSISTNGTNVTYATSSDYRLKTDLKNYNGICLINQIKTYDFAWKLNDARTYGVIAHELSDVIPYAVTGEKDALDERGCILPQAVDYSKIVTPLIKAVQEQQCTICSQASRITLLESCLGIY